jgi:pimeloyl-ACP methyl ester carboxylesterase
MLSDIPAELTIGKEDPYVGWWFKNKVYRTDIILSRDVAGYVRAYARDGRMDAAFDYCRKIVEEFNAAYLKGEVPIPLLTVGGDHAIPTMGESLRSCFQNVTSVVIADSGHLVPEEQPEASATAFINFLAVHG